MKYSVTFVLILSVIIFSGKACGAKEDADKIVRDVEKTLKKLKTVTCSFEQTYHRKIDDRTIKRTGTLWLKAPHLLRFEDATKTVVVDGVTVWMYIPRNNQVQISTFIQGEEGFPTPKSIFERYSKSRKAEHIGRDEVNGDMCDVLLLVSSDQVEQPVKVWIDSKLHFPVKTLEESRVGDTVQYVLYEIMLNKSIDDKIFTFVTPEGVETVDLRE